MPTGLDCEEVFLPKAFTPNGDGLNDTYGISNPFAIQQLISFEIFDRWGGLAYSATHLMPNDLRSGWDGTIEGKPAWPGTYVYKIVVELEDGKMKEFLGSFMLMR